MDSKQLMHYLNQVIAIAVTILLFSHIGNIKPADLEVAPTLLEETSLLD